MDPDSFLNLLSPGLNELDVDWGSPSDADVYSTHALAWLSDGFVEEGMEEEDGGRPATTVLNSIVSNGIVANASEYSSVLKLSDIASALHSFSKAAEMVGSNCLRAQKSSRMQDWSSVPPSPSPSDMCISVKASHHSRLNVLTVNPSSRNSLSGLDAMQSPSFDKRMTDHSSCVNANLGIHAHVVEHNCAIDWRGTKQGDYGSKGNERESSSKLGNDQLKDNKREFSSKQCNDNYGCNYSTNENKDIDDEDNVCENDADEDKDGKPCVSHVRIIRRPHSNCGQVTAPSPKRMKFTNAKVEAASSCEMASSQEDRNGGGSLKKMRKEGMSQREVHILSERQRRKSMRESFSILQSLVPKLKLKHTDRITVLTEVITYIQSLHGTLEELERKKWDIMDLLGLSAKPKLHRHQADLPGTVTYVNTSNNGSSDDKVERSGGWCSLQNGELVAMVEVTVRMCGSDVFITLNTPRQKGVWSGVLFLLQKFSVEVSNATLGTSGDSSFHCIHGKVMNMSNIEGIDLQDKLEGVIVKELRRRPRK